MNLTTSELDRLKACKSEQEWNEVSDEIKAVRGGEFPPDWWEKVSLSGLGQRVASKWGSSFRIKIRPA